MDNRDRIIEMAKLGFKDTAEIAKVLACSEGFVKYTLNAAGLRSYRRYAARHYVKDTEAAAIKRGIVKRQREIQRLELRLKELG